MVLAQYYNLVRYGPAGYTYIMKNMQANARVLGEKLAAMGQFELIGPGEEQLPLVAFRLAADNGFDESTSPGSSRPSVAGWCPPTPFRRMPKMSRSCGPWSRRR
jgi:glutamate/tyrosine decarboxylase-like PLP-dependent enzyme